MKNSTDIRKSLWIFGIVAIVLVGFTSLPILVWGSDKEVRLAEDTAIASLSGVLSTNSTLWTTEGPFGGYINSLTLATTNPDIIYAGTDGGLFKTIDSGHIWTKTSFPEMVVRVVQVVPDNPDIVYAGTTDDGIYKSEDGGDTWTQKGLSGARVNAIAIDPINPYTLYAGAGGIYKSTDGGETWQLKYSEGEVAALLIDAANPSYIYAGIDIMDRPGLRKSTDGGETWVSIKVGNLSSDNVVALAMTPAGSTPSVIYAANRVDADVFKSTDRGESWTRTNTPGISFVSPWALAVDPNNPNVIYVGTHYNKGLYKSTDGGNTWSIEVKGLPYGCPSSIVINPRNSTVYVGLSNGGVYKSKDMGESWNFSSYGMNNTWIEALAVHPTSSDTVFAGIKGKGHHLAKTTNGGISWDCLVNSPTNIQAIAIDPQTPSTLFVGRDDSVYIYNSTDGGQSWVGTRLIRVIGGRPLFGVSDIWINPKDSNIIMATVDHRDAGVFRSTDGGVSWTRTHVCRATTLAADPNNPNVIYLGTSTMGYVYQSTDCGCNWTKISPGAIWVGVVRDIEVDLNSEVYVVTSDGLEKWDNSEWTNLRGLPTDDITDLAIDRSTSTGTLYVCTEEYGVFVSKDRGNTWIPFNDGLGNLNIRKLAISASQPKMLYAGTKYGGVWSRPI